MALDTGLAAGLDLPSNDDRIADAERPAAPTLAFGADIGQALRAVREHQRLTLDELAETTRVRAAYLEAIENLQLQKLPSRPFTIGYVRAYAQALGLDAEAAVERFKADEPVLDEPLRAPLGVMDERDPRLSFIFIAGLVIVAAIVLWNLAQRGMTEAAPPPAKASERVSDQVLASMKAGKVSLGAPLPAPSESTTPDIYETPGLAEADENGVNHSQPSQLGVRIEGEHKVDIAALPATFKPDGAVHGAPASVPSVLTLQALGSSALIVRGGDGTVYFARQMRKGEAYRVPAAAGLVGEASDPDHFQVFVGGHSRGLLPATRFSMSSLAK